MIKDREGSFLKKVNVILGILLLALLIVGAYYFWGTNLKADIAAVPEDAGLRCDAVLSNGSLFPYEYLEIRIISPEGASLSQTDLSGRDLPALSRLSGSFVVSGASEPCIVEIGYYVLGRRKTLEVTVQ